MAGSHHLGAHDHPEHFLGLEDPALDVLHTLLVCEGTRNGMKKTGEAAQAASPQKRAMTTHRDTHVTV